MLKDYLSVYYIFLRASFVNWDNLIVAYIFCCFRQGIVLF